MTISEQRLHPLSIIFGLGSQVRSLIVPAIAVIFLSRPGAEYLKWQIAAVILLALVASLIRYLTFRIRYDEREMVIRSGIFVRNERHIPYARIQNIDATQSLAHRVFGVIRVHLQTAGGDDKAEASFSVLKQEALAEMRLRVFGSPTPGELPADSDSAAVASPPEQVILHLTPPQLMMCGLIENRGMVLIVAMLGLALEVLPTDQFLARWIDDEAGGAGTTAQLFRQVTGAEGLPPGAILIGTGAILGALLVIRLISTVWALVRLYNFTVTMVGDDLRVEHGMFTRVTATIPLRRVQSIDIHRGKLHRLLKMARLSVSTAGGNAEGESGQTAREPLAPIIPDQQLPLLLSKIQPDLALGEVVWQQLHPGALGRRLRIALIPWLMMSGLLLVLLRLWALPLLVVHAVWIYISAQKFVEKSAWSLNDSLFLSRSGWLRSTVTVVRVSRMQVVSTYATPFDRRTGMAQVHVDTAGSTVRVRYLADATASRLAQTLAAATARTSFRW